MKTPFSRAKGNGGFCIPRAENPLLQRLGDSGPVDGITGCRLAIRCLHGQSLAVTFHQSWKDKALEPPHPLQLALLDDSTEIGQEYKSFVYLTLSQNSPLPYENSFSPNLYHYALNVSRTELCYFRIIFGNFCSVISEPIFLDLIRLGNHFK